MIEPESKKWTALELFGLIVGLATIASAYPTMKNLIAVITGDGDGTSHYVRMTPFIDLPQGVLSGGKNVPGEPNGVMDYEERRSGKITSSNIPVKVAVFDLSTGQVKPNEKPRTLTAGDIIPFPPKGEITIQFCNRSISIGPDDPLYRETGKIELEIPLTKEEFQRCEEKSKF